MQNLEISGYFKIVFHPWKSQDIKKIYKISVNLMSVLGTVGSIQTTGLANEVLTHLCNCNSILASKQYSASIAFTLALFSHLVNHVNIRLQAELEEGESDVPPLHTDNTGMDTSVLLLRHFVRSCRICEERIFCFCIRFSPK